MNNEQLNAAKDQAARKYGLIDFKDAKIQNELTITEEIEKIINRAMEIYAEMVNGGMQNGQTLDELRQGRTAKQIKECSEWLSYCVSIGYDKNSADELEKIYWKFKTTKP